MVHQKFLTLFWFLPGWRKNRLQHSLVASLVSLMLGISSVAAQTNAETQERFTTVESFIAGGARGLALRSIETQQNSDTPIDSWMRWERLRIRLYRDRGDWSAISERSRQLPSAAPVKFRQWLLTEAAQAELSARRGAAARRHLRHLIWSTGADQKQMAHWRRLIIRSYLIDNRIDDARTALLRYKSDYRATSDAWQILHARVLMRARDYQQAFRLLGDIQTLDARLLRLHAALNSGIYKPEVVMARARRLAGRSRLEPVQQRRIWLLAVQAARSTGDKHKATAFLELALAVDLGESPDDPFFPLKADDLWQSYIVLAEAVGNRERLLVGDDAPWLEKAEKLESSDAVSSRAIYGLLALRAGIAIVRDIAHQRLTDALFKDGKQTVARAIYSRSARFSKPADLPDSVRYNLANEALKANDIRQAARWMKGLHQPPAGEDVAQWMLRRARTLVYAGDTKPAIGLLRKMLRERNTLDDATAKRTIQVLFDLQAVREHAEAYELMELVYHRVNKESRKRELLYWMGDSRVAQGQYQKAAELYLRSATMGQPKGADLWGQSARYQAAEAMAKAGLAQDARSIYRGLLRVSEDAKRRALIERKLQQLWLLENRNTTQ